MKITGYRIVAENMIVAQTDTKAASKNALVTRDAVLAKVEEIYGALKSGRATTRRTNASAREMAAGIGLHRQAGGSAPLKIGGR